MPFGKWTFIFFRMVCLWVLFKKELLEYLNTLSENPLSSDIPILHYQYLRGGIVTEMEKSQDENWLSDIAVILIKSRNDLSA